MRLTVCGGGSGGRLFFFSFRLILSEGHNILLQMFLRMISRLKVNPVNRVLLIAHTSFHSLSALGLPSPTNRRIVFVRVFFFFLRFYNIMMAT
jgi:hypothetical protein